jgi:hypothetical protein
MTKCLVVLAVFIVSAVPAYAHHCVSSAHEVKPDLSASARESYEKKLVEAKTAFQANPSDADATIWLGRRTAYLGEYKEAIKIFTEGTAKFPNDARFYRHRGHRLITLRCFDDAIADFEKASKLIAGKADEIEPDGLPNAKNIPTGTLKSNIWYHLALAYYLKADFKNALRAYLECEKVSRNNDMRVATAYWHYMTLRRLGKVKEAARGLEPFAGGIEVIENTDYLKLIKLNRGEAKPEELIASITGEANTLGSASLGYGIGNYFLYNGDNAKARAVFQKIVAGNQWSSFGYIAAEAELTRMNAK